MNKEFLLTLSGLMDIYEKFGAIVQVTQEVHLLPHERLDLYAKSMEKLSNMAQCMEHKNCEKYFKEGDKIKCMWPQNHADKKTLKDDGKIRGLQIERKFGIRAAGLQSTTRRQAAENLVRSEEKAEEKADEKLLSAVKKLSSDLRSDVYSPEGRAVIANTRTVLDLPALAKKLKDPEASATKVSVTEFPKFKSVIEKLPIISLQEVPEDELKIQFKVYLKRLAEMTFKLSDKELDEFDPKELIKNFMDPARELFKDIEMIMQVIKFADDAEIEPIF